MASRTYEATAANVHGGAGSGWCLLAICSSFQDRCCWNSVLKWHLAYIGHFAIWLYSHAYKGMPKLGLNRSTCIMVGQDFSELRNHHNSRGGGGTLLPLSLCFQDSPHILQIGYTAFAQNTCNRTWWALPGFWVDRPHSPHPAGAPQDISSLFHWGYWGRNEAWVPQTRNMSVLLSWWPYSASPANTRTGCTREKLSAPASYIGHLTGPWNTNWVHYIHMKFDVQVLQLLVNILKLHCWMDHISEEPPPQKKKKKKERRSINKRLE